MFKHLYLENGQRQSSSQFMKDAVVKRYITPFEQAIYPFVGRNGESDQFKDEPTSTLVHSTMVVRQ